MFHFDLSKPLPVITISTRQIFFNTLITNLEKLISFIRQEFSLPITAHEDLLKANPLGKTLLEMHQSVQASYKQETKTTINFEKLSDIVNFASSATNYDRIKETLDALNEIIIKDIKTSEAHLNYCDLDCITAQKILTDLVNVNSDSTPTGAMLWRVCLSLKREHGHVFVMSNADLINRMRQLSSFQSHEPIDDAQLTALVLENPWMFALFTKKQLIDLFICSDKSLEILKKKLGLRYAKSTSDEVIELSNSLFLTGTDEFSEVMHLPVLEEQNQMKRALANYLVGAADYARNAINDAVVTREFMQINGFFNREFVPYLYPVTIIKLFRVLDDHTPKKAHELRAKIACSAEGIKIDAHRIRGCNEFKWLLTRIEEDIKAGIDLKEYFSQNKDVLKIPYLLYELILRGLLQFPLPRLLNLFRVVDPDIILETLQLLDTDDLVHNYIEIGDAKDKYYVDKSNPVSFHRLMQLLLSDEFLPLRLSWFNNRNTSALILSYPVLLKGLSYAQMQQLMSDHSAIVLSNAEIGLQKVDFNPYVVCPLLLAYLPEQHIKFIKLVNSNPAVCKLYVDKLVPQEVLIHYIKNYTFDVIQAEIPEIMNYVDLDLFTKVDKSILDKQLLMAMLADEKFKMVIKLYPSILNTFDPTILSDYINNTNKSDAVFLRQVARQAGLIGLIFADFDQLMSKENINLFKSIIQILYLNPETEALIEKIKNVLKLETEILRRKYDKEEDRLLLAKAVENLKFEERPYSSSIEYPELSQTDVNNMFLDKEQIEEFSDKLKSIEHESGQIEYLKEKIDTILSSKEIDEESKEERIRKIKLKISEAENIKSQALVRAKELRAEIDARKTVNKFSSDPIIMLLEKMINGFPHWAFNFIQSPGFYPALNQYCVKILEATTDNIKRELDQCASLFQYASLYIRYNEFEKAAVLLKEYLMLLGVNKSMQNYRESVFYLFISCAERLAESNPISTLDYYVFAADLLFDAESINVVPNKNDKVDIKDRLIKDFKYKLAISFELAKKVIALIHKNNIPQIQKDKSLRKKRLYLINILPLLLTRGLPLINFNYVDISHDALAHQNMLNHLMNSLNNLMIDFNKRSALHTDPELLKIFGLINSHLHSLDPKPLNLLDKSKRDSLEAKRDVNEIKLSSSKFSGFSRARVKKELSELMHDYTLELRQKQYPKRKKILLKSDSNGNGEPDSATLFKKPTDLPRSGLLKPFLEKLKSAAASPRVSFDGKAKIGDKEEEQKLQKEKEEMMRRVTIVIEANESSSSDESSGEENAIPNSPKNSAMTADKPTEPLNELSVLQEDANIEQSIVSTSVVINPTHLETDSQWQNRMNNEIKKIQPENASSPEDHAQINEAAEKENAEAIAKEEAAEEKRKIQEALKKAKEKEDARNKKLLEEARKKKEEEDKRTEEKLALQRKIAEDERLRLQIIEDERKEKERIELQKKMEQEAIAKKVAEEKRKKAEEEARLKKEQEDKRRKEEEEKRKILEAERKLKEQEASEAHKKKLQEFKQKMLNDEREKKLAEEKRMEELERKRKLREQRDKELQLAREVKANEKQIAQEEQRLLEEERRLTEEERKLTEELKTMNAALQSDAAHKDEPQPVKAAKKEDPNKILYNAIGKELLNTIIEPKDNKAFEVARKRSGSAPVALANPVNCAGFFAQSSVTSNPVETDGTAMRPRGETQPIAPVVAVSQSVTTAKPLSQPAAAAQTVPANTAVVITKTNSVKDAIAAANKLEAAKNQAKAEIAGRVERKRTSSQPPSKSAPMVVDERALAMLNTLPQQGPTESDVPPPRPSLEGVVDEKESARINRGEIAQQNMTLFAASKAEMEREAENPQDEKSIKSGRRRGMSFTSNYEAVSFFKSPDKSSATESVPATSSTDTSRPKLPRSTSMGRITVFHPQPTETREEPIQTMASASSRPNRFGNPASSIAEKIGVGKLASVPLTPEEQQAIDAQIISSKAAMSNKRKN